MSTLFALSLTWLGVVGAVYALSSTAMRAERQRASMRLWQLRGTQYDLACADGQLGDSEVRRTLHYLSESAEMALEASVIRLWVASRSVNRRGADQPASDPGLSPAMVVPDIVLLIRATLLGSPSGWTYLVATFPVAAFRALRHGPGFKKNLIYEYVTRLGPLLFITAEQVRASIEAMSRANVTNLNPSH